MNDSTTNLPVRKEFGATEVIPIRETASSAVAAQAKAMVEARYIMALQRPRNWDQVRQSILRECKRPSFAANKSAFYKKPIGKGVEGLGIRFTEMALRCMTNVLVETTTIYEDPEKEIVRITVTDLEANTTYPMDVPVSKTVERSKPEDDGSYFSYRINSYNKPVYTVRATDDDMLNKRAALISKAQRTLALRIIPGDIQDEAEAMIKSVRMDEAARDPDAERKRIADAFAEVGVKAADLIEYLGHGLDTCSPTELVNLRGIYSAISTGEATWGQVIEAKGGAAPAGEPEKKPTVAQPARKETPAEPAQADPPPAPKDPPSLPEQPAPTPPPPADPTAAESPPEGKKPLPHEVREPASAALIQKVRDRAAKFKVDEARILQRYSLSSLDGINTGVANIIMTWIMAGCPEK